MSKQTKQFFQEQNTEGSRIVFKIRLDNFADYSRTSCIFAIR